MACSPCPSFHSERHGASSTPCMLATARPSEKLPTPSAADTAFGSDELVAKCAVTVLIVENSCAAPTALARAGPVRPMVRKLSNWASALNWKNCGFVCGRVEG